MSMLKDMLKRHRAEIDKLRTTCKHDKNQLKVYKDHSVVGRGSATPSVHIICKNCGSKKVMFISSKESKTKIEKTLNRQEGIKDQRLGCVVTYEWELDGS